MTKAEQIKEAAKDRRRKRLQRTQNLQKGNIKDKRVLAIAKAYYHKFSGEELGKYLNSGTSMYERSRILGFYKRYFVNNNHSFKVNICSDHFKIYIKSASSEWKEWDQRGRKNYVGYICNEARLKTWINSQLSSKKKIAGKSENWDF